ncbi:MAG: prolipoprotein diacylglyceryl transferase [Anaerolineales bacterium]|nr:prolipoprotein diacylglyceryl transferase [Anaerolineales bacterium]
MFPYLRLGLFILPLASLSLLIGLWVSISIIEREASRLNLKISLNDIIFYSLLAGAVGGRIGYALEFPTLFISKPLSLFSLSPTTLSPIFGVTTGLIFFLSWIQRKKIPFLLALDATAPGLAMFMVFVGISHIFSGNAYGAPTTLPWGIHLSNEYRHPSQFYETLIAVAIFFMIQKRILHHDGKGINFLFLVVLSSLASIFLEAFRGDSNYWFAGLRVAQIIAFLIMIISLYFINQIIINKIEFKKNISESKK